MRRNLLLISAILFAGVSIAPADLIDWFNGYDFVSEIGVSGLQSSYHADTQAGRPLSGTATANLLPSFGPDRVTYPHNIGQQPSPAGSVGRHFDQGALGILINDDTLTLRLATGLDPQHGYYYNGWKTTYGQGDLFIDVQDSTGVRHLALLNSWATDDNGAPISLNGGHFAAAQSFHLTGSATGGSLVGHLVNLNADSDVTLVGGTGSYAGNAAPAGLDLRVFAQGGTDLGNAHLTHDSITERGQTWYIETWTLALSELSGDPTFNLALHASASCGNDQIGAQHAVPEPTPLLLTLVGLAAGLRRPRGHTAR